MALDHIEQYLKQIDTTVRRGDATERTHYPTLKSLVEHVDAAAVATTEPKRIACGAPDFVVSRGEHIVGYIEAKDVGTDLQSALKSDQLTRYRESLANLILTNYIEFLWIVDGEVKDRLVVGALLGERVRPEPTGYSQLGDLLRSFLDLKRPSPGTPKQLAERMARLARMIRPTIAKAFEIEPDLGNLHSQYEAFRETLLPELSVAEFADMYAQTIAYGLFAARCMWDEKGTFGRQMRLG